jgi:hypothetical protein
MIVNKDTPRPSDETMKFILVNKVSGQEEEG